MSGSSHCQHCDKALYEAAFSLISLAVIITFVCLAVCIYIGCRIAAYIYYTFEKYAAQAKILWYSLGVCLGLWLLGGLLSAFTQQPAYASLASIGTLQLLLVCFIVRRRYATTFMKDRLDFNLVQAMTQKKWFTDDVDSVAAAA